jgi:hypothetical protein
LRADGPIAKGRFTRRVIRVGGSQTPLLEQRSAFLVQKLKAKIRVVIGHDFMDGRESLRFG